jgi:hypothetical protein
MSAILDNKPCYVYFAPHSSEDKVKIGSSHKVFSRLKDIKGSFNLTSVIALEVQGRKNAYDMEFMFIRKWEALRTHSPYDHGISGSTEWFDKSILTSINDVLQEHGHLNKVRRIDDLWAECMKDAINPSGQHLPIRHLIGDGTIAHDERDSIDLREKLAALVGLSSEYSVDRPYVDKEITRLSLKSTPEDVKVFEYFTDILKSIERHPRFRSIGDKIVHSVNLVNDGASVLLSFALDKPEEYSNEIDRAKEEIYSEPINYIRSLAGHHKNNLRHVRKHYRELLRSS